MKVKDIMVRNVISVSPDDNVSQAISKMRKHNVHQLLVMDNDKLYGLLELKKIATKDIEPSNTKVSGLAINVPTIESDADLQDVTQLLLNSGLRALPVKEGGKIIGVISETDMMKSAKSLVKGINLKVKEIASPIEFVEKGAKAGSVKRIMRDKNVSRVPVIENEKFVGVVGTLDVVKILEGKERMPGRGGRLQEPGVKEKVNIEETPVEAVMHEPVLVSGDDSVGKIIDILKKSEEVIAPDVLGIVTPKDILELFSSAPKKQLYVQITGMQNESIDFQVTMDRTVDEFVKKMSRMGDIQYLFLHVDKIDKGGKHDLYSIRSRFKMPFGFFVSHASGWKPLEVIQEVTNKLEREVMKKHGKRDDARRQRKQKDRYM